MSTNLIPFEKAKVQGNVALGPALVDRIEARLRTVHNNIVTNMYEAGGILCELRKQFPHGQWGIYLNQLCSRVGMSKRVAYDYIKVFEDLQEVGGKPLVDAAKDAGLNLNKKPDRLALIEAKHEHSHYSPAKIAESAKSAKTKHKNPAVDQLPALRQQFPDALIQRVGKGDMVDFEVQVDLTASKVQTDVPVMALLTPAQLHSVKGDVTVVMQGDFKTVKQFLKANA